MSIPLAKPPGSSPSERLKLLQDVVWAVRLAFSSSWWMSLLLVLASLSAGARTILEAYLVKLILDGLMLQARGEAADWQPVLVFAVLASLLRLFDATTGSYVQWPSLERLRQHVEQRVFDKLAALRAEQLEDREVNDLIKRVRDNFSASGHVLTGSLNLLGASINIVGSIVILALYSPLFITAAAVTALPRLVLLRRRVLADYREYGRSAELYRKRTHWLEYMMSTAMQMELRMLGAVSFLRGGFSQAGGDILGRRLRARNRFLVGDVVLQLVVLGLFWWFLVQLVFEVGRGALTIGDFQYYFRIAGGFIAGVAGLISNVGSLQSLGVHVADLRKLLSVPEPAPPPVLRAVESEVPEIELRDVHFRYPGSDHWVLRGITLRIRPGEKVAIVGENGAGKTTLLRLLMGFYQPTAGTILIDGIDSRELETASWHRCLELLMQDFGRFAANSLAENVAFADVRRLDDRPAIAEAARLAAFARDAERLPAGYDTILSPRFAGGAELSGGQWQKVALARTFFRPAPVVILDEPTSSIDAASEATIFDHLEEIFRSRTVILVSHRHHTIRAAHRILVMKEGVIVEEGTHHGLMEQDGEYARTVRAGSRERRL